MNNAIHPPNAPDYYRALGVSQTADPKVIRQAFKRLALATHPDKKVGESTDAASFRKVREAYEFLSDPNKRAQYDKIYLNIQEAWRRYYYQLNEYNRREQERAARIRAEWARNIQRRAEEDRRAAERWQRKIDKMEREAEKARYKKAREAEKRSREAARRAWKEQQRAARERIRQEREAAAEARSREVLERLRAEQEKAALNRLEVAAMQEKLDASHRNWVNLRQSKENRSSDDKPGQPSSTHYTECKECGLLVFGWHKNV
ncbi:hypothetical protein GGR51DRAFT_570988 [Nemania sp. FL0031]|nr:hypothetical protein GGR51DRAFT_570988 [Nemania sp. FL0031]